MDDKLEHFKDEQADDYNEDAREASRSSFETENQLSSNLITVTLAFVALIATAISTSNVLYVVVDFQKYIILAAMVIFCASIIAGLVNYLYNMNFHRKTSVLNENVADRIEGARTPGEIARIRSTIEREKPRAEKERRRSRWLLIAQIFCVVVGLCLTVAFVASLLFYTATTEDYTEDLPIYDEIMEDQAAAESAN